MSTSTSAPPSSARLIKATALCAALAALVLVVFVLPAEYGIDPSGAGRAFGLTALAHGEAQPEPPASAPSMSASPPASNDVGTANVRLAARADAAFGKNAGQVFDADAVSQRGSMLRQHQQVIELAPGKGAEVKAKLAAGEGMVFSWSATGDVAVDMHGEATGAKGAWTSYSVEKAQRASAGTFIAPFAGTHGWYWLNRSTAPVRVTIQTSGFQPDLYRP